jgi:hypothetical protein
MIPEYSIDDFVERHYRKITGKVFSFEDEQEDRILIYAERKTQPKGNGKSYTYDETKDSHIIGKDVKCLVIPTKDGEQLYKVLNVTLGEGSYKSPNRRVYQPKVEYEISKKPNNEYELLPTFDDSSILGVPQNEEYALVGYYKSQEQLNWIHTHGLYNIPAQRRRKNVKMSEAEINTNYLILHNENLGTYVRKIAPASPYLLAKDELPLSDGYVPSHKFYMIYDLDLKVESNELLDILVKTQKFIDYVNEKKPLAFKMSAIRKKKAEIVQLRYLRDLFEGEETFKDMVAEDSLY